jgi:hypothetical protein
LKLNRINNTDQWIGAGFRITSQHLELEGIELISDPRLPAAILEGFAITAADNLAERLASHYGLVIAKDGQTPPKLTEFELNATQMTERMERKGLIELVSKEGYKVWVDWSFGIGGLESNKTLYIQKLTTFANDLVEQDMWELMKARQEGMEKLMLEYGKQLNRHLPVLQLAEELMKHSSNPKVHKAIEDLNQMKL